MLNKVTLIGRLGMVPEIKQWPSGDSYASFRMATSESWKDKSGAKQEKTEWHNVTVTDQGAVRFCEMLNRGDMVYVEGKIETRSYNNKEGETKYVTEILVKPIQGKIVGVSKARETEGDEEQAPLQTQGSQASKEDWSEFFA